MSGDHSSQKLLPLRLLARGSISHKAPWRWLALNDKQSQCAVARNYIAHAIMPFGGAFASKRLARAGTSNALVARFSGGDI